MTPLLLARQMLADPACWLRDDTSGYRDENGELHYVPAYDPRATCFCIGFAVRVAAVRLGKCPDTATAELARRIGVPPALVLVGEWNDDPSRTHEEILKVLS